MMWLSGPELVAAVSNAGGLGVMASAMYPTAEAFALALDRLNELTDKPFAVNLNLFPARRGTDNWRYLEVMATKGGEGGGDQRPLRARGALRPVPPGGHDLDSQMRGSALRPQGPVPGRGHRHRGGL